MNTNESPRMSAEQLAATPAWLDDLLNEYGETVRLLHPTEAPEPALPDFEARCDRAITSALWLAQLRREHAQARFEPVGLAAYLADLAEKARVSLGALLSATGAPDPETAQPEDAPAILRLTGAIGISLRETLLMMRIQLAEALGYSPAPLLAVRARSARSHDRLAECEAALSRVEQEYRGDALQLRRRWEASLRAASGDPER